MYGQNTILGIAIPNGGLGPDALGRALLELFSPVPVPEPQSRKRVTADPSLVEPITRPVSDPVLCC